MRLGLLSFSNQELQRRVRLADFPGQRTDFGVQGLGLGNLRLGRGLPSVIFVSLLIRGADRPITYKFKSLSSPTSKRFRTLETVQNWTLNARSGPDRQDPPVPPTANSMTP